MNRQELIDFCLSLPFTYEDYPFGDEWCVIRHRSNKKSAAFIYEKNGKLCVNLKCEPLEADFLRRTFDNVTAGYHMNKTHWNTVVLDNGDFSGNIAADAEIKRMIENSYNLIKPKRKPRKTAVGGEENHG
ncbi:MAG: MmcQ/YjbR family DNA-binding protein [Oscillospiraceae bacterium]|nr:MmcQ/YjbR family DNA-binding protein [Oscillospiraceae bacterium]